MAKSALYFKDVEASYRRIEADIRARKFAPVYLLMGEESYFIDRLSDLLATTILNEAERSFNQIVMYGLDSDAGNIVNFCRQMPMMGDKEVIIVKEAQKLSGIERLAAYTAHPQTSTVLVICHKEKSLDKRSLLYKSCLQNGTVLETVQPRDYEIRDFLTGFVTNKGLRIESSAVEMLADHLGTDISKISNELEKLVLAMPADRREITATDIENNVGISKEFNIYELCAATAAANQVRAMRIADEMAQNMKNTPLLLIVLALFGTYRELFIYNYLVWTAQHNGRPMPSDQELMRLTGVRNSVAMRNLRQNAPRWPNRRVYQILGILRDYDAKSKGMDKGSATDAELLCELMLKIFNA